MNEKSKKNINLKEIPLWLAFAIITAAITARFSPGNFWRGFSAASVFAIPGFLAMFFAWQWGGRGKLLGGMMLLAFALRLGFGLGTLNLLPTYGYPNEPRQQKGYLSDDAYRREEEVWRLAHDDSVTLTSALTRTYNNDQYGGLASISLLTYKVLSSDARRSGLIILLGAIFTAIGVPFFRQAIFQMKQVCGIDTQFLGNIATWIYILYPDSIVFGGAILREPFLTGILAVVFWALATIKKHWRTSLITMISCIFLLLGFSTFIAAATMVCSAFWIWGAILIPSSSKWLKWGIIAVILVAIIGGIVALPSINEFVHFDIHTTETNSGWVEKVIGEIGGQFRTIFLSVYGIAQPILPAIIFYQPTTPYWKIVGIFRAAGWYLIAPFLFYALFKAFRIKEKEEKPWLLLNALFIIGWVIVSSFRAGGDQWDNPRYRIIFLPWLAFFTAWGYCYAVKMKDWMLVRWISIEIIFVLFFSQWYYSRYSHDAIRRFPFWKTVIYIVICSALVFATTLINPIRAKLRKRKDS